VIICVPNVSVEKCLRSVNDFARCVHITKVNEVRFGGVCVRTFFGL
jgi:hypothetical protein